MFALQERTHIHEDKPPRSVLRYRVEMQWKNSGKTVEKQWKNAVEKQWKNAVKKCSKAIKKQAKNLHKRKTCITFVSNKRTKDPAIRGMIKKSNTMKTTFNSLKTQVTYDLMFKAYCTALGLKASKWEEINWLDGTSDINAITE